MSFKTASNEKQWKRIVKISKKDVFIFITLSESGRRFLAADFADKGGLNQIIKICEIREIGG